MHLSNKTPISDSQNVNTFSTNVNSELCNIWSGLTLLQLANRNLYKGSLVCAS